MKRFKNILFVVDPEKACKPALDRAVALAENNQADLAVVDVMPPLTAGLGLFEDDSTADDLQTAAAAQHLLRLESLIKPYQQRLPIQSKVLMGTPYLEIIREVLRKQHDLVIRPPENAGWLGRLFGTDDMNLLRQCPCAVLLIKCKGSRSLQRIMAAVDVGDSLGVEEEARHALNVRILEIASALALSEFAELHVAHVWDAPGEMFLSGMVVTTADEKVAAYVNRVKQRSSVNLDVLMRELSDNLGADAIGYLKPKTHLLKGSPRQKLPALARRLGVDLVVMGTVARAGVPGLLMGNTAETILQQVDCSVLAIKPPGFITPVSLED
jgi:universal stress protein E